MQLNAEGMTKIDTAIAVIKEFVPPEGYYVANSGGKDSGIIVDLCKRTGVKFDAHYCVSPIDPPEVYKFLKDYHPETVWDYHAKGFWNIDVGYPIRKQRWCCRYIKESGGEGRTVITGIRWAESAKRSQRCLLEPDRNKKKMKTYLHAIICWSDEEVWEYYRMFKIPHLSLYDNGWTRVGCVGCPLSNNRLRELANYPKIAMNWRSHGDRYFDNHPENKTCKALGSKGAYWNWWLSGLSVKKYLNLEQGKLFDEGK